MNCLTPISSDVPLRTRRVLSLYKVYDDSALLVLKWTSLNCNNALLALNWRYFPSLFYCQCEGMCHYPWITKKLLISNLSKIAWSFLFFPSDCDIIFFVWLFVFASEPVWFEAWSMAADLGQSPASKKVRRCFISAGRWVRYSSACPPILASRMRRGCNVERKCTLLQVPITITSNAIP